ncbi:hypothetical protein GDO81_018309 [Engystomops pustulosus]|uniref:Periplakin/Envoplakin N-terminal domain-containing protein n=1 Tax=Engystomops pustulosus TaxID=76066 RepID=A0AAV7A8G0_ENGPU|nr:hypothetical protein GDO81_018309 [Engystomops pustulosus]
MGMYITKFKKPSKPQKNTSKREATRQQRLLIHLLQKNADQVEQNILEIWKKLQQDAENNARKKSFEHQDLNAKCLMDTELLFIDIFLDADKVKQFGHPQAKMIERDIHLLYDNLGAVHTKYREVYEIHDTKLYNEREIN